MRGVLRRESTFAATKQTVERIEKKLVGHSRPRHFERRSGALVKCRPLPKDELGRKIEVAPLFFREGVFSVLNGIDELRAIGLALPR